MCTVVHMSTYEFHRDGIEPLGLPAWLAEIMTEILEYVPEMSVPIDAAISMYLDADATGYGGKWSKPLVVADVLSTVLPSSLGRRRRWIYAGPRRTGRTR